MLPPPTTIRSCGRMRSRILARPSARRSDSLIAKSSSSDFPSSIVLAARGADEQYAQRSAEVQGVPGVLDEPAIRDVGERVARVKPAPARENDPTHVASE